VDDLKGLFNLIIVVVVVAATLLGPMIERWRRRQAEQVREKSGEPPPPPGPEPGPEPGSGGPTLPYETVIEEVFGPYMARRRAAHAARLAEARGEGEEAPEEVAAAEEEAPAPPVPPDAVKGGEGLGVIHAAPAAAVPPRLSLEERLFGDRRLGDAAKLVIAAEILQPPRSLRGRSRTR